jgi:hypothetical protein
MRGFLLFIIAFIVVLNSANGQRFSAKDLLVSSFTPKKFDNYLSKRKFSSSGRRAHSDTLISFYNLKPGKRNPDSAIRNIETYRAKEYFAFTYTTSSKDEFETLKRNLTDEGFFCGNCNAEGKEIIFQRKEISVQVNEARTDEDTLYSFAFKQDELPSSDQVQHADDLLLFKSHENLATFFGEKNVIKDIYYFSEKEISKCSVLFPKTSRQAVFIWEDEENFCKPSYVIVGGGMRIGSAESYDGVIGENVWTLKDGIYPGMTINHLVKLNGESFRFHGSNSAYPYMVTPDNTGALSFKQNRVMLGCLNPTGSKLLNNATVNADEILSDNLGMYVLMIMVFPQPGSN